MELSRYLDRQPDHLIAKASRYLDADQVAAALPGESASPHEIAADVGASRPKRVTLSFDPETAAPVRASCTCKRGTLRRPCAHILALAVLVEEGMEFLEEEEGGPAAALDPLPPVSLDAAMRDLEALQRLIRDQDFESPEAVDAFLAGIGGQEVAELAAAKWGDGPLPPAEEALRVLEDAYDAPSAKAADAIAERALKIDPDCVPAMTIRAESAATVHLQVGALKRVVARAAELLGETYFQDARGRFWGVLETRPYMRARASLAARLVEVGQYREAMAHYAELLDLNEGDNQGLRYDLIVLYVAEGDYAAAKRLYRRYPDEGSPVWTYARAVAAYRELGDTQTSRGYRRTAIESNPYVVMIAADLIPLPPRTGYYTIGSEEEAAEAIEVLRPILDPEGGMDVWFGRGL